MEFVKYPYGGKDRVVVYGPSGDGKTMAAHAKGLARYFRCDLINDGWDGHEPIRNGELALTNIPPPYVAKADRVVPFKRLRAKVWP